jgi:cytochrome c biogenesis protein CcmG, thiol:disulfide interchange protein DsbE
MNVTSTLGLAAACLLLALRPAHAIEPGTPAPDIALAGSPAPVNLQSLKGKVVYVDFWASWCGPCRQSFPWMNAMQAKYAGKGLQIVGVNLDARRSDADTFLAEVPAAFSVAFDAQGETPKRYAIKGMPTSVLIGPDGRVIQVHSGFRQEDRRALEDAIAGALSATH